MAIPVRLILGDGRGQMDLFTTSIDVNIGRNVQQFPTPDLMAGRIGIDLNTPEIKIDLQGILYDDDFQINGDSSAGGSNPVEQRSNLVTAINFNSVIPSSTNDDFKISHVPTLGSLILAEYWYTDSNHSVQRGHRTTYGVDSRIAAEGKFIVSTNVSAGTTNIISTTRDYVMDGRGSPLLDVGETQNGWFSAENLVNLGVGYASGSTNTIRVKPNATIAGNSFAAGAKGLLKPSFSFVAGDRIVKSDGTLVGTVASTSDSLNASGSVDNASANTVTFTTNIQTSLADGDELFKQLKMYTEKGEDLGYVISMTRDPSTTDTSIALAQSLTISLKQGERLYFNSRPPIEDFLHGEAIKLFPSAWVELPPRSYAGHLIVEDEDMVTTAGVQGIRLTFDGTTNISQNATRVRLVGAVTGSPGDANYNNGDAEISIPVKGLKDETNPAQALAQKIVDSLNLFSEDSYVRNISKQLLVVPPDVKGPTNANPTGTSSFHPQLIFSSNYINMAAAYPNNFLEYEAINGVLLIKQLYTPSREIVMPNPLTRGLVSNMEVVQTTNYTMHGGPMSAGDKVQNLMAMVSNAAKNVDLIRGIQIPYNSLITSPNINGTTRNFFTTFGQVDPEIKVSTGNELVASAPMVTMEYNSQMVGGQSPPDKKTLLERIGDFGDGPVGTIMNFLVNTADTIWTTLTTESHGNINGMNVVPNKLHVRYDAGNNYYAFNLELLATDFIIGV